MLKQLLDGRTDVSPVGLGVWVNVVSLLSLPLYNRVCLQFGPHSVASEYLSLLLMVAMPIALYGLVRRPYPVFARGLKFGAMGLSVLGVGMAVLLALIIDGGFI